jgi:hypothetical protein
MIQVVSAWIFPTLSMGVVGVIFWLAYRPRPEDRVLIRSFVEAQGNTMVSCERTFTLTIFDFEGEPRERQDRPYRVVMRTPFGNHTAVTVIVKGLFGSGRVVRLR